MILRADARHIPLRDECVQCVVTSPPYFGLRRYEASGLDPFGNENSIDLYVQHTVEILREIRRVLKPSGIVWWNVGDSYAGSWGNYSEKNRSAGHQRIIRNGSTVPNPAYAGAEDWRPPTAGKDIGARAKNLCLIPSRVAIAAQSDGWYVRAAIVWRKKSPMPESVLDRPTRSHEMIYMLTKADTYFYNWHEARDPLKKSSVDRLCQDIAAQDGSDRANGGAKKNGKMKAVRFGGTKSETNDQTRLASGNEWNPDSAAGANWRDVWDIAHEGYSGAHFATMPMELARRCIMAGSAVGDVVFDPFGGSGTTARVAIELNRRPISMDLAYHDHAERRTRGVQRRLIGM